MSIAFQDQNLQFAPSTDLVNPSQVPELVDTLLSAAEQAMASDIHLLPTEAGLQMRWRVDGVLHDITTFPRAISPNIVSRLKVLAELLTYHTDLPQEGRIRRGEHQIETRVSTFPTLFGEKAVIRLFVGSGNYRHLSDLQFPEDIARSTKELLAERGGVLLVTGPAGSGKTTTLYACLRELTEKSQQPRSIVTLEDPIEAVVEGISQSQIKPHSGFDYQTGLRSLMRQDPEVILVGEIRDRETAEIVFEASLTGHLVLSSFHAGSSAEAISRLLEMGMEPYQIQSGLLGVINQRLARKLCDCASTSTCQTDFLGFDVSSVKQPVGCPACSMTGYKGRLLIAELLIPGKHQVAKAIQSRCDSREIEQGAKATGMTTRWQQACQLLEAGDTSPEEVRRVLGFG